MPQSFLNLGSKTLQNFAPKRSIKMETDLRMKKIVDYDVMPMIKTCNQEIENEF